MTKTIEPFTATTQLAALGCKVEEIDQPLHARLIITGPNGSGKTSVAEAIRFLALGHIPALGKRHGDTAAIMADRTMSVMMTLTDNRQAARTLSRDGKRLTAECIASWIDSDDQDDHHAAIRSLFGPDDRRVAEMLDVRTLLNESPNKRAESLQPLLEVETDPDEVANAIAEQTVRRLAGKESVGLDDWRVLVPILPAPERDRLQPMGSEIKSRVRDAGISAVIDWAKNEKNRSGASVRTTQAAQKELESRMPVTPLRADGVEKLEAERDELLTRLGHAEEQAATAKRATSLRVRLASLESDRNRLNADADEVEAEEEARIEAAQARYDALSEELAELGEPPKIYEPDTQPLREKITDAEADADESAEKIKAASTREREAHRQVKDLEHRIKVVCDDIEQAVENPASALSGIADRVEQYDAGLAREIIDVMILLVDDVEALRDSEAELIEELKDSKQAHHEAAQKYTEAEAADLKARNALVDLRKGLEHIVSEGQRVAREHIEAHRKREHDLRNELQGQRMIIDEGKAAYSTRINKISAVQSEIQTVEAALSDIGDAEDVPDLDEIMSDLDRVTTALKNQRACASRQAELERIVADLEAATVDKRVYTAVEWGARAVQRDQVSGEGPLVTMMADLLQASGRAERPYIRAGARSCEIGWQRPSGATVPVEALSGGEWALFCAAITTAMLAECGGEIKPLLVEADAMDDVTLSELVQLAGCAVDDGLITNVVVTTWRDVATLPISLDGWTQVEV